jgi:FHA domain/von Willebrand factor type A domain
MKIETKFSAHLLIIIYLCLAAPALWANDVVWQTHQGQNEFQIQWWIQGGNALPAANAVVMADGRAVPNQQLVLAPNPSFSACYLFLTDTSLSMQGYLKQQVIPLLTAFVEKKPEQHLYAIGGFDAKLEMFSSFSKDIDELKQGIQKIHSKGQRTELFRAALSGLEQLEQCKSYRKLLILFSDGDAEDLQGAYSLKDVIEQSKEQQVAIITISFKDSIQVQNLMRLSQDTGGWYTPFQEKDISVMPERLSTTTDNGGRLMIKRQDLPLKNETLELQITLFDGAQKKVSITMPVFLDTSKPFQKYLDWLQRKFPQVPIKAWKVVLPIIAVCLLILLIIVIKRLVSKPKVLLKETVENEHSIKEFQPLAVIKWGQDTYVMDRSSISIGALKENDLVINDLTMGRYQATIDYKDNKFYITDRGATNPTLVNGKPVQHFELSDGDLLQCGDWQAEFKPLLA